MDGELERLRQERRALVPRLRALATGDGNFSAAAEVSAALQVMLHRIVRWHR